MPSQLSPNIFFRNPKWSAEIAVLLTSNSPMPSPGKEIVEIFESK